MIFSFRTRLFVIAGLIVGLVLTAVLLVGYGRVLSFEVVRLDERLCMEARRLATQPFQPGDVERLQVDVMSKLRISEPGQLMLKFESNAPPANEATSKFASFESRDWPSFLTRDTGQWTQVNEQRAGAADGPRPELPEPQERPSPGLATVDRPPPAEPPPRQERCALTSFEAPQKQWRAARFTARAGRGVVAADLTATKNDLQAAFLQALQIVVPLALLLTGLGAWLLSALTMRPVTRLSQAMANMTQKALDARMPTIGEDREFVVLIDAYNAMLARLELSFQQTSRFSSDAAHELKTPLTILQGNVEQALIDATQPALQVKLMSLLDEITRLSDITRKLLLLSQADAGYMALQRAAIDVSEMLDEMAIDMHMLLTTQRLDHDIARNLVVNGDAVLLRQVFNNLISNAVRHGLPAGWIKLTAQSNDGRLQIELSNATPPIDARTRAQFFDRFFRGDSAHSRAIEGSGLGLSLSREIARAHGGDLVLLATAPGVVSLRLTLPIKESRVRPSMTKMS